MPFSVALKQPRFDDDDLGFDFGAVLSPLISTAIGVAGQFGISKINTDAIKSQIAAQAQATKDITAFQTEQAARLAQAQAAVPITASPYFMPALVAAGLGILYFATKGKR